MLGSAKTNLPLLTLTSWVKGTSPFGTWWFLDWELWGFINWELLGFISHFQPIDRCSATIDSRPLGTRSSQNLPSNGGSCVPALQYLLTIAIFTADLNYRRSLLKTESEFCRTTAQFWHGLWSFLQRSIYSYISNFQAYPCLYWLRDGCG